MKYGLRVALVFALAVCLQISTAQSNERDSWEADESKLPPEQACTELDRSLYAPVPMANRQIAIVELAHVPAIALTKSRAEKLLNVDSAHASMPDWSAAARSQKLRPYLIRAVAKSETNGAFFVSICGDTLEVVHGSLGHSTPSTIRAPLVVFLTRRPNAVFARWSIAE